MSKVRDIKANINESAASKAEGEECRVLELLLEKGRTSENDALMVEDMRKRDYIRKHHKYAINHCE